MRSAIPARPRAPRRWLAPKKPAPKKKKASAPKTADFTLTESHALALKKVGYSLIESWIAEHWGSLMEGVRTMADILDEVAPCVIDGEYRQAMDDAGKMPIRPAAISDMARGAALRRKLPLDTPSDPERAFTLTKAQAVSLRDVGSNLMSALGCNEWGPLLEGAEAIMTILDESAPGLVPQAYRDELARARDM